MDLGKIDRVPVSMVVPVSDTTCAVPFSEWVFEEIRSPEKFIRFERGDHGLPSWKSTPAFIERMVQTIETGDALQESPTTSPMSDYLWTFLINLIISFFFF